MFHESLAVQGSTAQFLASLETDFEPVQQASLLCDAPYRCLDVRPRVSTCPEDLIPLLRKFRCEEDPSASIEAPRGDPVIEDLNGGSTKCFFESYRWNIRVNKTLEELVSWMRNSDVAPFLINHDRVEAVINKVFRDFTEQQRTCLDLLFIARKSHMVFNGRSEDGSFTVTASFVLYLKFRGELRKKSVTMSDPLFKRVLKFTPGPPMVVLPPGQFTNNGAVADLKAAIFDVMDSHKRLRIQMHPEDPIGNLTSSYLVHGDSDGYREGYSVRAPMNIGSAKQLASLLETHNYAMWVPAGDVATVARDVMRDFPHAIGLYFAFVCPRDRMSEHTNALGGPAVMGRFYLCVCSCLRVLKVYMDRPVFMRHVALRD